MSKFEAKTEGYISQPEVLREQMGQVGLQHGDKAVVNIDNVHVDWLNQDKTSEQITLFFCYSRQLEVQQRLAVGDGQPLPEFAEVSGLHFEKPGYYNLRNVQLFSNGKMSVSATPNTEVTLVHAFPARENEGLVLEPAAV